MMPIAKFREAQRLADQFLLLPTIPGTALEMMHKVSRMVKDCPDQALAAHIWTHEDIRSRCDYSAMPHETLWFADQLMRNHNRDVGITWKVVENLCQQYGFREVRV